MTEKPSTQEIAPRIRSNNDLKWIGDLAREEKESKSSEMVFKIMSDCNADTLMSKSFADLPCNRPIQRNLYLAAGMIIKFYLLAFCLFSAKI